jgi:hypothetical protein
LKCASASVWIERESSFVFAHGGVDVAGREQAVRVVETDAIVVRLQARGLAEVRHPVSEPSL